MRIINYISHCYKFHQWYQVRIMQMLKLDAVNKKYTRDVSRKVDEGSERE